MECTGSLLTSEVKRRRARLVLGWGTAREDLRVLPAFDFVVWVLMYDVNTCRSSSGFSMCIGTVLGFCCGGEDVFRVKRRSDDKTGPRGHERRKLNWGKRRSRLGTQDKTGPRGHERNFHELANGFLRAPAHRWRPYRVECTGSLLTSEVKRRRARLVLGWGTAWEDLRVLSALCFPMFVFVGADSLDVCFVVCCVHFFQILSISLFLLAGGARQIKGGT